MENLIKLLEENARYTNEELAVMLGTTPADINSQIKSLEASGVLKGYKAIVDKENHSNDYVVALIELKVAPKRGHGFDEIACIIAEYPEVEDLYLMSGGFDLAVFLSGKSFKEIALFVSQRLAVLDSVISTATHFVLSTYKSKGILMHETAKDERGQLGL
ncbi:MAG: Lrp/AsnC family transcriptional regulator [Oscillospiraceae bacterium]